MNRQERRAMGIRGPARAWCNYLRCDECGAQVMHVELSETDDEPYGPPPSMLVCDECGGDRTLVEHGATS